jgi:hypothetical protein
MMPDPTCCAPELSRQYIEKTRAFLSTALA